MTPDFLVCLALRAIEDIPVPLETRDLLGFQEFPVPKVKSVFQDRQDQWVKI